MKQPITKTRAWIHDGDTEWFAANGYLNPEDMIDHNGNLDKVQSFMEIFIAYNQHNIANEIAWDTWPSWELCLTSIDQDYAIIDTRIDTESDWVKRSQWLAVMQFLYESPHITWEGYTLSVQGRHGTTFSFDLSLDLNSFVHPGDMSEHDRLVLEGKHSPSWKKKNGGGRMVYAALETVKHSLGSYWAIPDHVSDWGGKWSDHLAEETISFCQHGGFPINIMSVSALCIDDTRIWLQQVSKQIYAQVRAEWWEEHWPQGRPEDLDCQYSKSDWIEIRSEWNKEVNRRIHGEVKENENKQ